MKKVLIILIIFFVLVGAWLGLKLITSEKPVACTMEAKECSDGSYVSRIPPKCDFAPCPKEELIIVNTPKANEEIFSPLLIKGRARGFWFFEASFPIKLFDENNNLIATTIAQTQDEWMTEDFVPFEAELNFEIPQTQKGILVLEKDNPSGLPEYSDELRIPVILLGPGRIVKLYYYNSELDKDESGNILCSRQGLVPVERKIFSTQTPIQDAIKLLISGRLTNEEKAQGISTEYPLEDFSLKGASLKDGLLTLEFNDPNNKTVGGSCRVGILWF